MFQEYLLKINDGLSQGLSIESIIKKHDMPHFSPLAVRMIGVGEETGDLDEQLLYLSELYEIEVENITKNLSGLLEPLILIAVAVFVFFIALSIISPIYDFTGNLQ